MSLNLDQVSTASNTPNDDLEDQFYSVIERLKAQKALPFDSFTKQMPFFNFSLISKESQIKELFQDISDPNLYKAVIKNLISGTDEKDPEIITKRLSAMQVMGFAQVSLYKVLPCIEENCPNRPREIATHNQYKDYEYSCPFYHHEKDKRRLVITPKIEEEFTYKANYFEEGKHSTEKEKHSLNYFESMFHPLYYKMFRCKREYCNFSQFCPFYHSEEEKKTWDKIFSNFIRKDRISYVKDKKKYYEHDSCAPGGEKQQQRPSTNPQANNKAISSTSNINESNGKNKSRQNFKQKNWKSEQLKSPCDKNLTSKGWRPEKGAPPNSANKWDGSKKTFANNRKNSGNSLDGNSPISFDHFYDQKEALSNRVG